LTGNNQAWDTEHERRSFDELGVTDVATTVGEHLTYPDSDHELALW
jgi:hypothetical protein